MVMILAVMPISSLGAESDIVSVSATGYNRGRGENHLVVFTPAYGAGTGTNAYGTEATVDAEGKIISVETGVGNASIPEGGFVISGHGDMSDWVKVNCIEGRYCAFNQNTLELQVSDSPITLNIADVLFYEVSASHNGYNHPRYDNQIVIFNQGASTGTNNWGYEVSVQDGYIISVGGNNTAIPENGYVISGNGTGASWLGTNAKVGMKVTCTGAKITFEMSDDSYLRSIDADYKTLLAEYDKAKSEYKYCDYEYLDGIIEGVAKKREAYKSLETDEEKGASIMEMTELLKHAIIACSESRPVEYRGAWVTPTQKTQEEVSEFVQHLYDMGINTISLEGIFDSTVIFRVPEGSLFEHNPKFAGFDVLQAYIIECHKRGMELHLWMHVFSVGIKNTANFKRSVWYKKPEWRNINDSGSFDAVKDSHNQCFLNPAHPEVQDFLIETYKYIIETYDIDSFELDYIRYPGKDKDDWGYDEITVKGFKDKYGYTADPVYNTSANYWKDWAQYRCDQVSEFVRKMSEMVEETAPDLILSADVGTNAESAPEGTYQDFGKWAENGWVDMLKPMSYSLSSISITDVNVKLMGDGYLAAGVGAYEDVYNKYDVAQHIIIANECGADGVMIFAADTYLGKECYDYLLETGPFRNSAVTPTYDALSAAESMADYAIGRIDNVLVPLKGLRSSKGEDLKEEIEALKVLIQAKDKEGAITKVSEIIGSLEDNKAQNTLKADLVFINKILVNIEDNPRVAPVGPDVEMPIPPEEPSAPEISQPVSDIVSETSEVSDKANSDPSGWIWVALVLAVAGLSVVVAIIIMKKKK